MTHFLSSHNSSSSSCTKIPLATCSMATLTRWSVVHMAFLRLSASFTRSVCFPSLNATSTTQCFRKDSPGHSRPRAAFTPHPIAATGNQRAYAVQVSRFWRSQRVAVDQAKRFSACRLSNLTELWLQENLFEELPAQVIPTCPPAAPPRGDRRAAPLDALCSEGL